jgi:nicotinamide-nucleotide amidase
VFGADDDSFPAVIGELLRERREAVAVAESCTGGLIGTLLSTPPGASAYFLGSAVTYANEMKEQWAGVNPSTLQAHGAVSDQVARQMAEGVRARSRATYGLAVTGIAGPTGGTEEKPVGTVFFALAMEDTTSSHRQALFGDRDRIRQFAAYHALDMLRLHLLAARRGP